MFDCSVMKKLFTLFFACFVSGAAFAQEAPDALVQRVTDDVLEIIRKDIGSGEVRVDNPTQNLESYFLEVVEKAKQASQQTSGAQSGARVAEYLRGDGGATTPAPDKVLEKLTLPTAATPAPAAAQSTAPAVNEKKLDALTKSEPAPAPSQPTATVPVKAEDLAKADEKLSSLLGKRTK